MRRPRLVLAIAAIAGVSTLCLLFWAWTPTDPAPCPLPANAAWISVDWTSQPADEAAIAPLAQSAASHQLRYLFPFTTYLKADGSWSPSYGYAGDFLASFRRHNVDTRVLAWVGIPVLNQRRFGIHGFADLADADTRRQIADFAAHLVSDLGFDGIHLNVEHVDAGNPGYLLLLDDVRGAIGETSILSVACNDWVPEWVNRLPLIGGYKWDGRYLREVAGRVDQMVMMTYDSLMPLPALYRPWLREQVRGISRSLVGESAELLIGISVSREETRTHHPRAENVSSGLAGARAGIARLDEEDHAVAGVAIYAAWEMSAEDWKAWDGAWTRAK